MIRRIALASILLLPFPGFCGGSPTPPPDPFPTGPEAGRALAAQLRVLRLEPNTEMHGTLKVFGRNKKVPPVPFVFRTAEGPDNWSVTYETGSNAVVAAESLTVIRSTNAPNRYLYAVAPAPGAPLGEPRELKGAQADIPLAGTDFWLSDLGFEFYEYSQQNRLKGDIRRSTGCYVLESRNPHPEPGGYALVKSWITKEQNGLLQAEAEGADGKDLKSFVVDSVEDGEVRSLIMKNRKTGSRTVLEFDPKKK